MEDDDPHQPSTGAMTSKVKGQGRVISLSRLDPMLYLLSLAADGGIPCRPNPAATLLVLMTLTLLECVVDFSCGMLLWSQLQVWTGLQMRRKVQRRRQMLLLWMFQLLHQVIPSDLARIKLQTRAVASNFVVHLSQ